MSKELGAGAWSYFGDPRAISHDGHTFTGWISTVGHVWVARLRTAARFTKHLLLRGLGRDDPQQPVARLPCPTGASPCSSRPTPAASCRRRGIPGRHALPDLRAPRTRSTAGDRCARCPTVEGCARLHLFEPHAAARQAVALLAWRTWFPTFSYTRRQDRLGVAARVGHLRRRRAAVLQVLRRRQDEHPRDPHRWPSDGLQEQPLLLPRWKAATSSRPSGGRDRAACATCRSRSRRSITSDNFTARRAAPRRTTSR